MGREGSGEKRRKRGRGEVRKGEESPVGDFQWDISPNQLSYEVICECPFGESDKDISYMNIYRAFSLQGNVGGPETLLRSCWGN